jgi:hypothetical protein
VEVLEDRTLLSTGVTASSLLSAVHAPPGYAHPDYIVHHPLGTVGPFSTPGPTGKTPTQIRHAYGFDQITFSGGTVQGDGTGTTIAIVDAFDDPTLVSSTDPTFSTSDLHKFDVQFGLPDPVFTKVNQTGGTSYPITDVGWSEEISLDVEWAHAVAQNAKILLVEANDNSFANLLTAVDFAASQPGVVAVSMSWGGGEFAGESSLDSHFLNSGVAYLASTGDTGAPPGYPAISPNVVGVGGTSLFLDASNNWSSESGWSGSGGGISSQEPQPAYQNGVVTQSTTRRTNPDVAYDSDPNTGFPVLDTFAFGSAAPWAQFGGTSDAAPQWSALIAIADQGRALIGKTALSGASQLLPMIYTLSAADFHDITVGTSTGTPNYSAGPGYDLVTGRGTPLANKVVPDLVGSVATHLAFLQQPTNTVAGASISPAVTVEVLDQNNAVVTTDNTDQVTMAIGTNPGGGTLSGTLTITVSSGLATFSNLSINKTGTGYTLTAASGSLTGATSNAFNILPGAANHLVFGQQPTNTAVGASITPAVTVQILDQFNNLVTTDNTDQVTMAIGANPGGGALSGTNPVTVSGGVATFSNLSINKPGTGYTLVASSGSLTGATSSSFNITTTPTHLAFLQQPTNTVAGTSISPAVTVELLDAGNNLVTADNTDQVTVAIGTNPGGGTLSGTLTVTASAGIATFSNLSINKSGTGYTLTVSSGSLTGATSNAFNITPAAVNHLAFGQQPTNAIAGSSIAPAITVLLLDQFNNLVTTDNTDQVALAIGTNPGGGTLGGTTNPATFSGGIGTFNNVSINKTGSGYTLTAIATGPTLPVVASATSAAFSISPASPNHLAFGQQPTNTAAGASITPAMTVQILDQFNNLVTTDNTDQVTLAIGTNPGGGALSGTNPVTAVGGVATFNNLSINNPGNGYTLVASSGSLTGAGVVTIIGSLDANFTDPTGTGTFTTMSSPTNGLDIRQFDGGSTSFEHRSVVNFSLASVPVGAVVQDVSFNFEADSTTSNTGRTVGLLGYAGTGTLTLADATAAATQFASYDNFAVGLGKHSADLGSAGASLLNTLIGQGKPLALRVQGTTYGTNTLLSSIEQANSFPGSFTAPSITVTFTPVAATSNAFNITTVPTHLAFLQQPSNTAAGASITPAVTVEVLDGSNNVVSGDNTDQVTVAIGTNPGGGTLSGTLTVTVSSGIATFSNLSINKTGTGYTLTASSGSLTGATSNAFNITAAAANHLAFGQQPTNTVAGVSIAPAVTVQILDQFNNLVTTDNTDQVTMAIGANPGGGTLSGTNPVTVSGGIATFSNLSINKTGTGYTLQATSGTLGSATSSAFNITPAAADHLAFGQQPTNTTVGALITPAVTVQILDQFNNVVTTDNTDQVTLAIGTNPGGGTLSGTNPVTASGGVATFSNLSINRTGNGYTLVASSGSLTGATSASFNITIATGPTILEDFESGNLNAYTVVFPPLTGNVTNAAAHDRSFGLDMANGNDWIYRNDAGAHVQAGDALSVWVLFANVNNAPAPQIIVNNGADGRAYFGFGATATGTLSLVAAANTNQLILQNNNNYGFTNIAAVAQNYTANVWYRLEVDWGTSGTITGKLFASNGTTLLNSVTGTDTTITSGGIAFRAIGHDKYFDTVTKLSGPKPPGAGPAAIGISTGGLSAGSPVSSPTQIGLPGTNRQTNPATGSSSSTPITLTATDTSIATRMLAPDVHPTPLLEAAYTVSGAKLSAPVTNQDGGPPSRVPNGAAVALLESLITSGGGDNSLLRLEYATDDGQSDEPDILCEPDVPPVSMVSPESDLRGLGDSSWRKLCDACFRDEEWATAMLEMDQPWLADSETAPNAALGMVFLLVGCWGMDPREAEIREKQRQSQGIGDRE